MSLHTRFGRMVDAFRPAEGAPPATLMAFFRWCLSGAWPGLGFAAIASALGGVADVVSALLLGMVVDAVTTSAPGVFWDQNWGLVALFAGFFLVVRPAIYGLSTASSNVIIGPNILPLVLSRLHRWTMGHAVTFFDNDFAGRLAQKQMQTARAVTDVASEMVNVVAFASWHPCWDRRPPAGRRWLGRGGAAGLAGGLFRADPVLPAAHPREIGRARIGAGQCHRTGRRHHHQHQDGQAVRPCRPRGSGRPGRDGRVPRTRAGFRRRLDLVPAVADGRGGDPAGDPGGRRDPAVARRHRDRGRCRRQRRHRHAPVADDRVGQHGPDGHVGQHRRQVGRTG